MKALMILIRRSLFYKFLITTALFILVILVAVSLYSNYVSSRALSKAAKHELLMNTTLEANRIKAFLSTIESDLLFLANLPSLKGIVRATYGGGIDPVKGVSQRALRNRLGTIFREFAEKKRYYMQIRYLDARGKESVRVDFNDAGAKVFSEGELSFKGKSGYFVKTKELKAGEVFISPLNLNKEKGKIERPFKPVIRYAVPIFHRENIFSGIVVLNVYGK